MNYVASVFSLALDSKDMGLPCILHLHSESLITRGRNKIVIKFLSEEFTHLFWIDSDIAFATQSVFRLLRADRDVAAGVYPMKDFRWPAEGLPAGMTREQFETAYTDYPFNPIGHGKTRVSQYADSDGFVEVAEAPTGFMVIKRQVAQLRAGRAAQQSAGTAALALLRLHGRSRLRALPVRGLRVLPPLARHGRQDLGRPRLQAHAPRAAPVRRLARREPARAGPMVKAGLSRAPQVSSVPRNVHAETGSPKAHAYRIRRIQRG
jgi:hypothetical protein